MQRHPASYDECGLFARVCCACALVSAMRGKVGGALRPGMCVCVYVWRCCLEDGSARQRLQWKRATYLTVVVD
jgi:hypothetical protein